MLRWVLIFFIISLIAGLLGFTGISVATAQIAKFIFLLFAALFVITLILALATGHRLSDMFKRNRL